MINKLIAGIIISSLILTSCSIGKRSFISKHTKKSCNLISLTGDIKIGYETENAIIYIGKQDALKLTEKLLSDKNLDPRFDRTKISDLKTNLDTIKSISSDITVKHWLAKQSNFNLYDYNFSGFIDQWLLRALILKGNAEVWNKSTNQFEKRIIYHFVRDRLGGEDAYYTFQNGTEFHRQILRLGE